MAPQLSRTRGTAALAGVAGLATIGLVLVGCSSAAVEPPTPAPMPTAPPVLAVQTPEIDPGSVIDLATGSQDAPVEIAVDGGADGISVTYGQISIPPGESTGRHCHHGQVIGVVTRGQLTHHADYHPGGVRVYRAGDSIIEPAGLTHEARNDGPTDALITVTYLTTRGAPLAETDLTQSQN